MYHGANAYHVEKKGQGNWVWESIFSVFDFTFVELILDIINFDRINFEIKWFMFGSTFKSDSDRK